jgi:hypothetical protein
MVPCRGCGHELHETAITCPHCGAPQRATLSDNVPVPDGIKGWSWGAFLLNWIWGPFNGTWIAMLSLVPYIGFVMMIVLGFKGREWAWKNKRWDSVEHFNRVQRLWSIWALVLVLGTLLIGILAGIGIPAYQDWQRRTRSGSTQVLVEPPALRTGVATPA